MSRFGVLVWMTLTGSVISACGGTGGGVPASVGASALTADNVGTDVVQVGDVSTDGSESPAITIGLEERLGSGRALLAASNGIQTVVATTVEIALRDDTQAPFRSIVPVGDGVADLAISPDGERVAVVTRDSQLALWTTDEVPRETVRLSGATVAEFRTDGSLVVVGPQALRVVNASDGSLLDEWTVPPGRTVGPSVVSENGAVLVALTGGSAPEIVEWSGGSNVRSVSPAASESAGPARVERIVAAGDYFAVGVLDEADPFDGRIEVFDHESQALLWTLDVGEIAGAETWSLRPDGSLTVGDGSTVRNENVGGSLGEGETPGLVERIVLGDLVVLADGTVGRITDSGTVDPIDVGGGRVIDLQVDTANRTVSIVNASGRVGVVTDGATAVVSSEDFTGAPINDVAVASDGRIATAATDGVVDVRRSDGSDPVRLVHEEGNVDSVAFSPDGTHLTTGIAQRRAATAFDDTVSQWPAGGGERIYSVGGEAEDVAGCSFFTNRVRLSSDGRFLIATSHDFTFSVIDVETGEVRHTFPGHANSILDVAISPDDSTVVTSGDDSTMKVWDLKTFELIADYPVTMGGYWSLSYLPDGTSVVTGDLSGNLSIVDVATGQTSKYFSGTKLRGSRTAVSPDGRLVAAGADGSLVRIWSTATGEVLGEGSGHTGPVSAIDFDGSERLVSGSQDGTAIVWSLSS